MIGLGETKHFVFSCNYVRFVVYLNKNLIHILKLIESYFKYTLKFL